MVLIVDGHDVPIIIVEFAVTLLGRKKLVPGENCLVGIGGDTLEKLQELGMAELVDFFVCSIVPILNADAMQTTNQLWNNVAGFYLSLTNVGFGGTAIAGEEFWVPEAFGDCQTVSRLFGLSCTTSLSLLGDREAAMLVFSIGARCRTVEQSYSEKGAEPL